MAGAELALDATPRSVPLARRWLRAALGSFSPYDVEVAALLTSELVTNAILHARSAAVVRLLDDGDRLRVEVSDSGTGHRPAAAGRELLDAESGRGLSIVDLLATTWGATSNGPAAPGRCVWFELAAVDTGGSARRDDVSA